MYFHIMIILELLILLGLCVCVYRAKKSEKPIARILLPLIITVMVNIVMSVVILCSPYAWLTEVSYILSSAGAGLFLFFLVRFSMIYCNYNFYYSWFETALMVFVGADIVFFLLNPWLHHIYQLQKVELQNGKIAYAMMPTNLYLIHIGITYALVLMVGIIFLIKIYHSSRMYWGKYIPLFCVLSIVAIMNLIQIILRVHLSLVNLGMGITAVLLYYFAIEYHSRILIESMLAEVVERFDYAVLFYDEDGACIYGNEMAEKLFGVTNGNGYQLGVRVQEMFGEVLLLREGLPEQRIVQGKEGERIFEVGCWDIRDKKGQISGCCLMIEERTAELAQARKDHYEATHDKLTGLYNATHLYAMIAQTLKENPEREYTLVASDIKEFKLINDIFGTETGDRILKEIADCMRANDTGEEVFGRIRDDKFGLMLPREKFSKEAIAKGVYEVRSVGNEGNYPVVIQMGVYHVMEKNLSPNIMFDRCFMAIHTIKTEMQKRVAYYDDYLRDNLIWEQRIIGSLEEGLSKQQIIPFLQAQVDRDGNIVGAEALVRWQHPVDGFLPPGRFLDILEENGMIVRIDRYIWEEACKILQRWDAQGKTQYISVNISPKDFYLIDVYETFVGLVEKYRIPPERLRLEVTETVMMSDLEHKMPIIERLRAYGFYLEMDDFGSGYSSLNMLKSLPIDVLKLDMAFLRESDNNERTRMILELIINLAIRLEVPIVAEGVETEGQFQFLSEAGCNVFQGYLFAKPVAVAEFEETFLTKELHAEY